MSSARRRSGWRCGPHSDSQSNQQQPSTRSRHTNATGITASHDNHTLHTLTHTRSNPICASSAAHPLTPLTHLHPTTMSRRGRGSGTAAAAASAASTPTLAQMAAQMERLERSNQLQQEAIASLTRTLERLAPMAMQQQQAPQMWQTPMHQQTQPHSSGGDSVAGSAARSGPALQTPVQSRTDFSAFASPLTAEAATTTRLTPRQIARQSADDRKRLLREFKAEHERKTSRKKKRAPSRSRSPSRSSATSRRSSSSSSKARVSTLFQPTEASARRMAGVARPPSPRRDAQPDGASTARSVSASSSSHASRMSTPRHGVEPGDGTHRPSRNQNAFPPPPPHHDPHATDAASREQETELWGRVEGAAPRPVEAWSQTEHPETVRPLRLGAAVHPATHAAHRSPMHVHSVSFKRPPLSLHVDDSDRLTARSVASSTR